MTAADVQSYRLARYSDHFTMELLMAQLNKHGITFALLFSFERSTARAQVSKHCLLSPCLLYSNTTCSIHYYETRSFGNLFTF